MEPQSGPLDSESLDATKIALPGKNQLNTHPTLRVILRFRFILIVVLAFVLEFFLDKPLVSLKRFLEGGKTIGKINFPLDSVEDQKGRSQYVLLDSFAMPHWAVINSIAAHEIALKTTSAVATFGFTRRNAYEDNLYRSLGIPKHYVIRLTPKTLSNSLKDYFQSCRYVWKHNQILDLDIGGLNLGLDIYESFLRRGHATFYILNRDLYRELWRGIAQYNYFLSDFSGKKITAVLASHDNYVGPGLLTRIAYKFKVPVLLINPFEINIMNNSFQNYERFLNYRKYFSSQPFDWKQQSIQKAQRELSMRVNGAIGVGVMKYQKKSSFTNHKIQPQIRNSPNKKLLVLAHDFFDNPHGYAKMQFDDFYQWLTFVAEVCRDENIDCYIKMHRDFSEIEHRVLLDFKIKFSSISILDPEVSYHQLYDEGIRFVTTCYGSAGHELPLLGFTLVNASYNPHIAFTFNQHASTKTEYRTMLSEQSSLIIDDSKKLEIYEFFAVHSYLMWPDSFNLESFNEFIGFCDGELSGEKALSYLAANYEVIRDRVLANLRQALNSRCKFSVERDLKDSDQSRFDSGITLDTFCDKFK